MSLFPQSIRVPLDAIQNGADRLNELAERVADYFDQMSNLADGVSGEGSWVGEDKDAFVQANASNQKKYQKIIQNISDMAKVLVVYAEVMGNADHEQAKKIRSIG